MKFTLGILLASFLTCAACDNAKDSLRDLKDLASGDQSTVEDEAAKSDSTVLSHWPQWRGPLATGEAPYGHPPVDWNETKNIRWKMPLPCEGHSTPVIWGDRIFLTGTSAHGKALPVPEQPKGAHNNLDPKRKLRFLVVCLDLQDGSVLWQKTVRDAQPHQSTHESATWASHSPVTDGRSVYAFFGSSGLYALDYNGTVLWEKDLGDMLVKHGHGEGASPALFGDTLIVNWDHEGDSFVVALDKRTGKERWRQARDEPTSWASPIIAKVDGKPQAIVSGTSAIRGYDLATGKVVWHCSGLSNNVVATPVYAEGVLFAGSSYEIQSMLALSLKGAKGDLAGTDHALWNLRRRTPYVPSPLYYQKHLYFLRHYQAILTRLEGKTGDETSGPFRLPGILNLYASPVAAAGRIYLTDQQGTTLVLSADETPETLALNQLEDSFNASAAIVGDSLILRGGKFLYRVAEPE